MAAEEQQKPADEEDEPEEGLAGDEAPAGQPEDPGREQAEPDEGGGDDAEDGADHVEDADGGHHRQPDPDVPAGPLRGGDEVAAPGGVLLRDHRPGDEVGQDPPAGQAAEDDGEADERRVEARRHRQPPGHAAELPVVPRPQHLERGRPAAAATGRAGTRRRLRWIGRGRGRGRSTGVPRRRIGDTAGRSVSGFAGGGLSGGGRRGLVGRKVRFHALMIGLRRRAAYRG